MRVIYKKISKEVVGVIPQRITAFLPPSYVDNDTTYIDLDYNDKSLKKNKTAQMLEKEGTNLVGKTIRIVGKRISFQDKRQKQYQNTVMVDIDNPNLHKDVEIYSKKGREKGAKVEIEDIDSVIFVKILHEKEIVGTIRLTKRGCCIYVYQEGVVQNRDFYPHYVGFDSIIKYLHKKAKWLDMGGLLPDGKDDDLNRFKKKFGKERLVEVDWQ